MLDCNIVSQHFFVFVLQYIWQYATVLLCFFTGARQIAFVLTLYCTSALMPQAPDMIFDCFQQGTIFSFETSLSSRTKTYSLALLEKMGVFSLLFMPSNGAPLDGGQIGCPPHISGYLAYACAITCLKARSALGHLIAHLVIFPRHWWTTY